MHTPELPFDQDDGGIDARLDATDAAGRARAVDPRYNVVLEASAGTGKTRVLVDRYVNLLRAGVDPRNVLAITFTRKAATEMRDRVVAALRVAAERSEILPSLWRDLRNRMGDIEVSTIDAFCLSLLREFPLEADLDPGFSIADEHDVPRLVDEALDRALRTCRNLARSDEDIALVFAQLGDRRARRGLAALINRRLVAPEVLRRFLAAGPADITVQAAVARASSAVVDVFERMRGGMDGFTATGPLDAGFYVLARQLESLRDTVSAGRDVDPSVLQATFWRVREYFLTRDGRPRQRQLVHPKSSFPSESSWRVHRAMVLEHAGDMAREWKSFKHRLNVCVARGTWRMFRIAESEYRRTLDAHAVVDFPDVLLKTIALLRHMEEFAQSRFRLESRYHHVLVDEFQDTSRAQWELVSLLVQAWGQGVGAAYEGPLPPSIFIVGDRKQSIYGFRDADVALLQEASFFLGSLRPDSDVRRSISRSFRSGPRVLAFVNDLCHDMDKAPDRSDAFVYDEQDRFPVAADTASPMDAALGLVAAARPEDCAAVVAGEIARLIDLRAVVRDRETGIARAVKAGDVAILFRTRDSHREYERALGERGLSAFVHKGLGFFETDEILDVRALIWHFADPESDLRAAAFLRSRFIRLSDDGLRMLTPHLAESLERDLPAGLTRRLTEDDMRALDTARQSSARWRALVDRIPPAEWLDQVLHESAYAVELGGRRFNQGWENLKKIRALVRRLQNRGYMTLARVADHLDHLAAGDEANAPIDADDAVSLMTIHASKGLEFPVVFVVDLTRGTGAPPDPMRVYGDPAADTVSVSVGDFLSDADQDSAAKDREETKRLLYVAVTRARDRLYLGTVVKDGQVVPGRGSLAEILPASFLALFPVDADRWTSSSGTVHRFVRCERPDTAAVAAVTVAAATPVLVDREPLSAPVQLSRASDARGESATGDHAHVMKMERLIGVAVHRLLERRGFAELSHESAGEVVGVLRRDELLDVLDTTSLVNAISETYTAICQHPDVRSLYEHGRCFHEVPFSLRRDDKIVRGSIDCLVQVGEHITVLEFKTGRRRLDHEAQSALYCEAARALFPACTVEGRLIYGGKTTADEFLPQNPAGRSPVVR